MPRKKLYIFPYNGNGIEALDCLNEAEFEFLGFIDDDESKSSGMYEVFRREVLKKHYDAHVLAVPGSPESYLKRKAIIDGLQIEEDRFVSLVHPLANIGRNVKLGYNCLVMAGVVLTSNVQLGNHVCILPNTVIHHDSIVNDYTLIGSNVVVAGGTTIGTNCYIGSGSNIINGIKIGDYSLIGMGSNIIRSVNKGSKMVGNPAKNINP